MTRDDDAFRRLYDEHVDGLHAFLVSRVSDRETARDLLQEVLVRAWRRFDEVGSLPSNQQRGWLFTTARNLVVDRYRSDATRRTTVEVVARQFDRDGEAEPGGGLAPRTVEVREALDVLRAAIEVLPDEQREVLVMATVGELSSDEIGEVLQVPAGTVRYRLHRARTTLRRRLAHPEEVVR